jgi:hypothetical protein
MQPYQFNDVKMHSIILIFKCIPPKRSGLDCEVTVQTVKVY